MIIDGKIGNVKKDVPPNANPVADRPETERVLKRGNFERDATDLDGTTRPKHAPLILMTLEV